ncbi:MAG: hypothetical protein M0014_01010 [Actinomycetota bacterium]|jgi:hypothetical protein|nr:hypothetical protein [Actinomycetota bacterium]
MPESSPVPPSLDALDLDAVLAAATAEAAALRASGRWSQEDDDRLAEAFETAATQALRVPALAERSTELRRIARRVVPVAARPQVRRAAALADRLARIAFERLEHTIDRSRGR